MADDRDREDADDLGRSADEDIIGTGDDVDNEDDFDEADEDEEDEDEDNENEDI